MFLGLTTRISDSVGLRWLISNKFLGDSAALENLSLKTTALNAMAQKDKEKGRKMEILLVLLIRVYFLLQFGFPV